jgi:hypothetical protein
LQAGEIPEVAERRAREIAAGLRGNEDGRVKWGDPL